jgi:hypothetical protein
VFRVQLVFLVHYQLVDGPCTHVFFSLNYLVVVFSALVLFHLSCDALVCEVSLLTLDVVEQTRVRVFRTKVWLHEYSALLKLVVCTFNIAFDLALKGCSQFFGLVLTGDLFVVDICIHNIYFLEQSLPLLNSLVILLLN